MTGASGYSLRRATPDDSELRTYSDHTIFQTSAWLEFIVQTQGGEPVVADLLDGDRKVGRFTGVIARRYGMRLLGSPLPGWTTAYQGFNTLPGVSRVEAYRALRSFAYEELRCVHIEVTDRHAAPAELMAAGYHDEHGGWSGYEVDLEQSLDGVFAAMKPSTRRNFRRSEKMGVTVEVADDLQFVDDYYTQLQDVFAKQKLTPTYGIDRVRALVTHLRATGRLLLLRARSRDGVCIGTGIFPAANSTMYFWGGASWRQHQILRPNEALHWAAIRYWKERGITKYDMMGGGAYKENYGAYPITVARGRSSRYRVLERLRGGRKGVQEALQRVGGMLRR